MSNIFNITNIKAIILSLVIAIVLAGFVIYLIESFDPRPEYDDYCGGVRPVNPVTKPTGEIQEFNETECIEKNGTWRNNYCDFYYECQQEFEKANDKHNFVIFLVAVPAGLIAVGIGLALALPSVSSGLMLGGVFLTIYGTANYWDNFSNWVRVLILGIALVTLIWLAYRKLKI